MGSIPVEEARGILVVPWVMGEKEAKDFFREELVEDPGITMSTEGLVKAVVFMATVEVVEAVEVTLGEVVGIISNMPVEEGEAPIMLGRISKMNVVIIQLDMVG